jgi:hypothetical protein
MSKIDPPTRDMDASTFIEPFAITPKDFEKCISGGICDFRRTQYFNFFPPLHFRENADGSIDFSECDPVSVFIFLEYKNCADPSANLFPKMLPIILNAIEEGNYDALRQLASWVDYDNFPPLDASANLAILPFLQSDNDQHVMCAYRVISRLKNFESDVYIPIAVSHLQTRSLCQSFVASFLKKKTRENVGEHLPLLQQALSDKKITFKTRDVLRHFL